MLRQCYQCLSTRYLEKEICRVLIQIPMEMPNFTKIAQEIMKTLVESSVD